MKGRAIPYSADELAWLEEHRLLPISDYHAAFCDKFGRSDVEAKHLHALRKRKGWKTGRTGQFEQGQTSWNKGKAMPFNANSARTQFKPGNRTGRANENWKPIGTERLSKDGYLERKIHDGRPLRSRWRAVHLVEWEAVNGPVPDGHCLKCLDGDKSNTNPSNWACVPRALLPRLAGRWNMPFDQAEPEVKPTLLALAQLEHKARKLKAVR